MSEQSEELLKEVRRNVEQNEQDRATRTHRVWVDKRSHDITFENETEDIVEVVIKPRLPAPPSLSEKE